MRSEGGTVKGLRRRSLLREHSFCCSYVSLLFFLHRTPGIVASYVLKHPDEVAASQSHRELSELALYVPILSCIVLVGLAYLHLKKPAEVDQDDTTAGEATGLLSDSRVPSRKSSVAIAAALSPMTATNSRRSVEIMGIPQLETKEDQNRRTSLYSQAIDEDLGLTDDDF
jgi:hypothetical protein